MDDGLGNTAYAQFGEFTVAGEIDKYKLTVSAFSGTAGDSLKDHDGSSFTTWDNDNSKTGKCGSNGKSGWWFKRCGPSNLNGVHSGTAADRRGIRWFSWKGDQPLKGAVMKIDHHSKLSLKSIFRYLFGSFINYWNVTHSNTISVKKTEEKNA